MRFTKRIAFVIAGIICAALFLAMTMTATATPPSNEAAYKAATDTDPHLPLSSDQQKMLTQKKKAVANAPSGKASIASADASSTATSSPAVGVAAAATTSDALSADQNPQKTSWWCGPASVNEALGQMGVWLTQAQLAEELGTTTAGTGWSGGPTRTGFPVPDVMNAHQTRNYYIPNAVSYSPSSAEVNSYKAYLVYDISSVRAPLIGDAYEVPGGTYHLAGHPQYASIYHWFDIRGYTNDGAYTMYEDSVSGVSPSIIPWAPNVPAYTTMSSTAIVTILGGRGYVW